MDFLHTSHDPAGVAVSILIATLASFVGLDLARRVRSDEPAVALAWGLGGSVAFGTGIWATHFVGMLALALPFEAGYEPLRTALSWAMAVALPGAALGLASRGPLTAARLIVAALLMGGGICSMHYLGMSALPLQPGIVWNGALVAASVAIAVVASGAALFVFGAGCRQPELVGRRCQFLAAALLGLAIGGMHYTGMAAARIPANAFCLDAGTLHGGGMGELVGVAALGLLLATLASSRLDRRLREHLRHAQAELEAASLRDPLTGLLNRPPFERRLREAAAEADCEGRRMAVLYVDLDGFRAINDSLGHARGDEVLREAAARLLAAARGGTVARVGGDEFAVLVERVESAAALGALAGRVVACLGEPLRLAERRFSISGSVGLSVYPDDGRLERLLVHADVAMNAAKRAGGGRHAAYAPHMEADPLDQLSLQDDLRHAIERGELALHYQPKIDARSGALAGVEALLRWQHPQRGVVSPAVFIPLAERFGLIGALGDWVVDEACRQMAEWAGEGRRIHVAVNVSVHQLREGGLAARIQAALERHGIDPADLLCEITESAAMEDLRASLPLFEELLAAGVYLSIDDFGTGYSSLSYLRRLPARQLKIDRSFVNDLESSADARAVVHAVLSIAHALGLRVVAEGVETEGQRAILCELGCDELQGYLFARPLPAERLVGWLDEQGRAQAPAHAARPALAAAG